MSLNAIKLADEGPMQAADKIAATLVELGPRFAERATTADSQDRFVAENFAELKAHGLTAAGVPEEFGGLGATHAELCQMLRQIANCCGSTGLAFAMHTH
jgi:alkylation response protein AidB-like acyl-CoA dehydrogenase